MIRVRLTTEAIYRIKNPKNQHIKDGLGVPMGRSARATRLYALRANEWNGDLTKEAVIRYLEENLKMTREQLLEVEYD